MVKTYVFSAKNMAKETCLWQKRSTCGGSITPRAAGSRAQGLRVEGVRARTRVHTYTHTHIHTYTHTHIHTYTHTHIHTYTHTHIYTYTHTHIHTYTHKQVASLVILIWNQETASVRKLTAAKRAAGRNSRQSHYKFKTKSYLSRTSICFLL